MNKKFEALINKLAIILSKRTDREKVIDKFDACLDELAGADYTARADFVKLSALLKSQGAAVTPKVENEKEKEDLKDSIDQLGIKVDGLGSEVKEKLDEVEEKLDKLNEPSIEGEEQVDEEKEDKIDESTEKILNKLQESSDQAKGDLEENVSFLAEKIDALSEDQTDNEEVSREDEAQGLADNIEAKERDKQDKSSDKVTEAIKDNTKENVKSSNKYARAFEFIKGAVSSIGSSLSKNIPLLILGIMLGVRLIQKAWEAVRETVVGFANDVWDATPEWIRKPIRFIYNGVKLTVGLVQELVQGTKLRDYLEEHGGMDKMIADKEEQFRRERQVLLDKANEQHNLAIQEYEEATSTGAPPDVVSRLESKAFDSLHKVHDAEIDLEASHADAVLAVQDELKEQTGMINRWHAYDPEKFRGFRDWYRERNAGQFQSELQQFSEYLGRDRTSYADYTGDSDSLASLENVIYDEDISKDDFYDSLDGNLSNDQIHNIWEAKNRGDLEGASQLFWNFIERNNATGSVPENLTDRNGIRGIPTQDISPLPTQVSPMSPVDSEVSDFNESGQAGQVALASSNDVKVYNINNIKSDNYNLYGA